MRKISVLSMMLFLVCGNVSALEVTSSVEINGVRAQLFLIFAYVDTCFGF